MSSPPRVLIVDDDEGVLDVMQRTLRGPFDTVIATSVAEAIGVLVLLDIADDHEPVPSAIPDAA